MRNVLVGQILPQGDEIELEGNAREALKRLEYAREDDPLPVVAVDEGLLSDAVAREKEPPLARIPDREGEHPVEFSQRVDSILLVRLKENFDVGLRAEDAPALFEFAPQFDVVVYLAVEGQPNGFVVVREGLTSRA